MRKLERVTVHDTYPCIYLMINRVNGLIYVGQAGNLRTRYIGHRKKKHGKRLKTAIETYGFKAFDWYVLEQVERLADRQALKALLTAREQYYLDLFKAYHEAVGYNVCVAADSTLGYKHTDETKQRIRERRAEQTARGWVSPTLGTTRPDSVKEAVSKANRGKVTHRRPVKQLDAKTGELIKRWESATDACRALGIAVTRIASVALKRPKWSKPNQRWYVDHTAGGFKWEYDGEMITGRWDQPQSAAALA